MDALSRLLGYTVGENDLSVDCLSANAAGCYNVNMMSKLKDVLERVETWPDEAQQELAEIALEIESGFLRRRLSSDGRRVTSDRRSRSQWCSDP